MKSHGKIFKSIFEYSISKTIPTYKKGSIESIAFKQFKNSIDINTQKYIEKCQKNTDNVNNRWKNVFISNTKYDKQSFNSTFPQGYTSKDNTIYDFETCYSVQKNLPISKIISEFNNTLDSEEEIKQFFKK